MSDFETTNLLLVGLGHHAQRIYYPICRSDGIHRQFRLAAIVDLASKQPEISAFLMSHNDDSLATFFLDDDGDFQGELPSDVRVLMDSIVRDFSIHGVIISTDPLAHIPYARWALQRGLSVLMDKPLSTHRHISIDESVSDDAFSDYSELVELYRLSQEKYGRVLCSLMAQRRYHPGYRKVRELVAEVFTRTRCPITSIQVFHSDGQWRLPSEIVDVRYHSFNDGIGKCSHSGFHFFDLVPWLMLSSSDAEKRCDNVDIFANFLRPHDFLEQLTLHDYDNIFPGFSSINRYDEESLLERYANYGEIDAFNSFAFKRGERIMTLASINLVHNGFSQRGWLQIAGRDLYKGNGRVRHETMVIEQGPFQAIEVISLQANQIGLYEDHDPYVVGGERHFDIHVFRNHALFPDWRGSERFSLDMLTSPTMAGLSRGHQEDARRHAVLEFVAFLQGEPVHPASELTSHESGVTLLCGVYKSAARRLAGNNPVVNVPFPCLADSTDGGDRRPHQPVRESGGRTSPA